MLFFSRFILNKKTGILFKDGVSDSPKMQIIFLTDDILVTKNAGYTSYVHRGIGNAYSPAVYEMYSVKEIKNCKDDIRIYIKDFLGEVEVKNINNLSIIEQINKKYDIQTPKLTKNEQEWVKAIERNKSVLEELMLNSQNCNQKG